MSIRAPQPIGDCPAQSPLAESNQIVSRLFLPISLQAQLLSLSFACQMSERIWIDDCGPQ